MVDSEFYPTPAWCTRRILESLDTEDRPHITSWLEPCAGDGAITDVLRASRWGATEICGGDIRDIDPPRSVEHWNRAFGFDGYNTHFGAVITNPPFSLAPELIRHFLPRCDWLILLLRASFRLGEWRHNMPDEYKLPQRPEFLASEKCVGGPNASLDIGNRGENGEVLPTPMPRGCGWSRKIALTETRVARCEMCGGKIQRSTSDSSEYSWFVWTPERNRSAGLTRVLPDTPLEERKAR